MQQSALKIVVFILLAFSGHSAFSQLSGCNSAQNACNNPTFVLTSSSGQGIPNGFTVSNPQTNPQSGNGANPSAPPNSGCLLSNGPGPNWMIITVASNGLLAFSFGASSSQPGYLPQSGFYDWAMWAYDPNTTCTNIFNNTLPPVACCWNASSQGGTGMGPPTPSAVSASGNPLPAGIPGNFQPSIPVTVGQQFIILLSNYSGVTTNVSFAANSQGFANLTCSPLILPSAIRCPSQSAAITATWAANVSNVSYTITGSMPLNPATYTVQTSPTFVVAPAATHVYTVLASGSNTLGAVVTSSNTFTVTISPTTTMDIVASGAQSSLANADGNVCYGSSATFTAQSPGTNFTLTAPAPAPVIYSSFQIVSTPTLSTSGTYTLATSLFSGCTATGAVHINVAPNYSIAVNPPLNVCLNGTALLTASLQSATSYTWDGPNSFVSASATPTISNIQLSAGGTYTVRAYINYNGLQCLRTATTKVTVVATSSITLSAHTQTLCQASSLYLSASITGTAGFLWTGPHNFNVSAQTTTVSSMMPFNAGIYTVTAIFSNGMISCPRKDSVNVFVVATAAPTITSMSYNICQHDTARMSVTTGTLPSTFLWSGPAGFSSTSANPEIDTIRPAASGVYYVTASFVMGIRICPTHAQGQINVVPVSTVSVIPPLPVCRPNNVTLFSSANNAISYTWQGPNNFVEHQANPVLFHPQLNASGIYTITVAFGGGALVCYNRNTVSVTINPVINFSLTPFQQPCYNTSVSLSGPAGATSYNWTSSSGFTSTQPSITFPHVDVTNGGTYTLDVGLGNCITTQTAQIDVIDRIQASYLQQDVLICSGDSITLKMEVVGGNMSNDYAFIWTPSIYLNSPNIGIQQGVRPLTTTVYNVVAFDTRCSEYKISNSFSVQVLTAAKPNLQLATNMGCEPLCLLYDSKVPADHSIVTYDFTGDNGYSHRFQPDGNSMTNCLDAGIYSLKLKTSTMHIESNKVCSDSTDYPAVVTVFPKPGSDISWIPESPTLSENNVTFMSSIKNGPVVTRKWSFNGTYTDTSDAINQQRVFEYTGKYAVTLISVNDLGCSDTIVKYIEVKDDFNVYIPNSFTPNGDNLNDVFQMKGSGVKQEQFSMDVFDRWGSVMFSTKDPSKGWDGTLKNQQMAGEGIYVYKIRLSGANGEGKKEYVGQVTLIR